MFSDPYFTTSMPRQIITTGRARPSTHIPTYPLTPLSTHPPKQKEKRQREDEEEKETWARSETRTNP